MRLALLAVLCAIMGFSAGQTGLSHLSLRLGAPSLTLLWSDDPHLRGLALYRLQRYEEAAEALRLAGPKASFERGNALARAGKYRDALAAYDSVLAGDPEHQDAKTNRAIMAKLIDAPTEEGGGSRAQGSDPGEQKKTENKNNSMTMAEAEEAVRQRAIQIQRPQEARALIADEQWLKTLSDEPGRYLKLRIAAEYQRRHELGIAPPPGDDPW